MDFLLLVPSICQAWDLLSDLSHLNYLRQKICKHIYSFPLEFFGLGVYLFIVNFIYIYMHLFKFGVKSKREKILDKNTCYHITVNCL